MIKVLVVKPKFDGVMVIVIVSDDREEKTGSKINLNAKAKYHEGKEQYSSEVTMMHLTEVR